MQRASVSRRAVTALVTGSTLAVSACGSSTQPAATRVRGTVNVLYAGSLVGVMQKQLAPAFQAATGYDVVGYPGGSDALANQIKGRLRSGDVFISASPAINGTLMGAADGSWVSWYATFATSALVLGYNPRSRFAPDLKAKPWYQVVTQPGFLLGRTDPATDPKGKLAVQALDQAASTNHQPGLRILATSTAGVFPEETLVGRLQSGQLDAGFFYTSEAKAAGIATVPLTGTDLAATYTVTVLDHAPHPAGATAFARYLLGPSGQRTLTANGFSLVVPPAFTGAHVPSSVRR